MHHRLRNTVVVSGAALSRPDALVLLSVTALAYLVGFVWASGDLSFRPGVGYAVTVVDDPITRTFERRAMLSFEPVALVDLGVARVLLSPINVGLGAVLSALVGLNLSVAYLAFRQPRACGIGAGSGVLAAVPALLSGVACCAPVLFLVLGLQVTGAMLAVVPLLLPVGGALLIASLVYVAGYVEEPTLSRSGS